MRERKLVVTWEDYGIYINDLIQKIEANQKPYDKVCPIPRGGYPIAVAISHYFNIPIESHHFMTEHSLIVDDICDSGNTLKNILDKSRCIPDVATIFLRTNSNYKPLYWCRRVSDLWWIDFPYEYPGKPDTISTVVNE